MHARPFHGRRALPVAPRRDDSLWDVADARGRVLAQGITFAQLRARLQHGLLDDAALVASERDTKWRPLGEVLGSGTHTIATWYVTRPDSDVIVGPVDAETIGRGILAGKVPIDALVCRAGDHDWSHLEDTEFADHVAEATFDMNRTRELRSVDATWRDPLPRFR